MVIQQKFYLKLQKKVISIEADERLSMLAINKFQKINNITIVNGKSENVLKNILYEGIEYKNLCIYLDAHLCNDHITGSKTFGEETSGTPIMQELSIIEKDLETRSNVNILIDDIRLFDKNFQNYSKKADLVNWCLKNDFNWEIEQDIFIAKKQIKSS